MKEVNKAMTDLESSETYRSVDPSGMRGRLEGLPQQCQQAWQASTTLKLPQAYEKVKRIIVAGMGGSAIGGDLAADLLSLEPSPPIISWRDYDLPPWADEDTLVVVSSYSGETEETLSAFHAALQRRCKVIAITSGGPLKALTNEKGLPLLQVEYEGEPRCAVGWSFLGLLGLLQSLSLCSNKEEDVQEAVALLIDLAKRYGEDSPNEARAMARRLQGQLAVIYGAGILQGVARRWKTQINENAKAWAFSEVLPELNHNSVVGLPLPEGVKGQARVVLLVSPDFTHPRTALRFRVTREILEKGRIEVEAVNPQGKSALAQILSSLHMGDWVSYYLALLYGVDPSPVPVIDHLKTRMAEEG